MTNLIDLNIKPYYDTTSQEVDKDYYKVLFSPSKAIQARELNVSQGILQQQLARFGNHVFKEGSVVIPGATSFDTKFTYVKLAPQYNSVDVNVANFLGKTITGVSSGTKATVVRVEEANDVDPATLYVQYATGVSSQSFVARVTNGSNKINPTGNTASTVISVGAVVTGPGIPSNTVIIENNAETGVITLSKTATANSGEAGVSIVATTAKQFTIGEDLVTIEATEDLERYAATVTGEGFASRVSVQEGVYFVAGTFVAVHTQEIILDKYDNAPTYKVGLVLSQEIVDAIDDTELTDPALGSPNHNAPGADRLKLTLTLAKTAVDTQTDSNFFEILRLKDGVVEAKIEQTGYSEIAKTLARRTYDESGHYTVKYFPIEIREHLDNGTNRGVYSVDQGGDENKLVAALSPGKAYVAGYEIETFATKFVEFDKARDTARANNNLINFQIGNYVDVNNVSGAPDISVYQTINLRNAVHGNSSSAGSLVGTARVRMIEHVSGTPGTVAAVYRLWLFDISMTGSNTFANDVKSLVIPGSPAFLANAVLNSNGRATLNDSTKTSLIFQPGYVMKTLKDDSGNIDVTYSVRRTMTVTMSGNTATLVAGTNEVFRSYSRQNYHVVVKVPSATATSNGFGAGSVIDLTATGNSLSLAGSPVGSQCLLTIPAIAGSTLQIIATVTKTTANYKTKTLVTRTQTFTAPGLTTLVLDRCDIFSIESVTDKGTNGSENINIKNRYVIDDGQRDAYYDRGRLIPGAGVSAPKGNVVVVYKYFEHSTGDYFCADSYTSSIEYKDIPAFNSPGIGGLVNLSDSLDFRPRVDNGGSGFSVYSECVVPNDAIILDFTYYLSRIDKVYLDYTGNFAILKGVPAINPKEPKEPSDTMVVYKLRLAPYTRTAKGVTVTFVENKNYTMRDIGKLETRVNNLEYYTSLSLLEKDTADMFIDDGTGNNRFKNGFLVDNFMSHTVGDNTSLSYLCSIDSAKGELRPMFTQDNVGLELNAALSSGYTKTGALITLPYTTTPLISQLNHSRFENINPFNVFSWVGNVELDPAVDDWKDTNTMPDLVVTQNNAAQAFQSLAQAWGTQWNEWETSWTGSPVQVSSEVVDQEVVLNPAFVDAAIRGTSIQEAAAHIGLDRDSFFDPSFGGIGGGLGDAGGMSSVRTTSNVTYAVDSGQTRTGVRLNVSTSTNNQNLGSRVVDVTTAAFIRSRDVSFKATRLKPNTRVYPFFDEVAVSAYCKPVNGNLGDALISDNNGTVEGVFSIPNTETVRFRTGSRVFRLTNSATNASQNVDSSAEATYTASGLVMNTQSTILSTQEVQLSSSTVTDSRVVTDTFTTTETSRSDYVDPLAQTFLVNVKGGVFLSSIDIYFATKDETIPVELQLREVVNGYPGKTIIPFSSVVLQPSQINVSTDGTVATPFVFPSPVYLQDGTEYCFVLLANANTYNVWTAMIGENQFGTDSRITEQPYTGSMFKSQNASTWTPDQTQDVKFVINRCVFDTNVSGTVVLSNVAPTPSRLTTNPLSSVQGSNVLTVMHRGHTMNVGDKVVIAGSTAVNDIAATNINKEHTIVSVVDFDTYTIEINDANGDPDLATGTGSGGGAAVTATGNMQVNTFNVNVSNLVFADTALYTAVRTTDTSYTKSSAFNTFELSSNVSISVPSIIASSANETLRLAGAKSFDVACALVSNKANLSPVIDTTRMSVITVGNRINNISTDVDNETAPSGGKALARYFTKRVPLAATSHDFYVMFAACLESGTSVDVYYRAQAPDDDTTLFDDLPWVPMVLESPVAASENSTIYRDRKYVTASDPGDFSIFAIKIVMKSSSTSVVPRIRDFRAIALGT